ncbi:NUDIX domain-containing protein [Halomicrococcus gelatinilyticus]|uniref:NUDIX domain-containing protein n=1 Tax=Halomicrococcus gelatinilyticus TaxID=1702103 RepID=UPI002E0D9610
MNERYVVNVQAAVVRDGEFLLVRRAEHEEHAPGTLALVGGTVEGLREAEDALERTVSREVREEVGVEVDDLRYLESSTFVAGDDPCVNVVFLARHGEGTARPRDEEEVAAVQWFTADAVVRNEDVPPWTAAAVEHAERERADLGW